VVALASGLAAFDTALGTPLWQVPLAGRPTGPATFAGRVVVGLASGRVVAVDPASGGTVFSVDAGGPVSGEPLATGSVLVAATRQREVLAIAPDGAVRWRVPVSGRVTAPTAGLAGFVYVASLDGRLAALDAASGQARWLAALGGPVEAPLRAQRDAAGREVVAALRDDGTLLGFVSPSLASAEPRPAWTYRMRERDPAPAAGAGRLFAAGSDLVALDAATGRVLWRLSETLGRSFGRDLVRRLVDREQGLSPEEVRAARAASAYELRGAIVRPPVVEAGLVLAATDEGLIYAVDAATGELRWRMAEGD
jgi:outer membrane protein assembly factor BamB